MNTRNNNTLGWNALFRGGPPFITETQLKKRRSLLCAFREDEGKNKFNVL